MLSYLKERNGAKLKLATKKSWAWQLTHEWRMHLPTNEGQIHNKSAQNKQHCVQVFNLRFVDNGTDDKVCRNHENNYWNDNRHLVWTWVVWLCEAHNNECQHGATIKDPCCEAEEVNQGINCSIEYHCAGNERVENQSWCWSQAANMNVRKNIEQMPFTWCRKAETTCRKQCSVRWSESADGDTQRHDPSKQAENAISKSDRNSFRLNHLVWWHCCQVGDVDERIAKCYEWNCNDDWSREIPKRTNVSSLISDTWQVVVLLAGILNFLGDIIQVVPSIICPQTSVECCCNDAHWWSRIVKRIRQVLDISWEWKLIGHRS